MLGNSIDSRDFLLSRGIGIKLSLGKKTPFPGLELKGDCVRGCGQSSQLLCSTLLRVGYLSPRISQL